MFLPARFETTTEVEFASSGESDQIHARGGQIHPPTCAFKSMEILSHRSSEGQREGL